MGEQTSCRNEAANAAGVCVADASGPPTPRDRKCDESGTGRDESGKSRDESATGWDESAARGAATPRLPPSLPPPQGSPPRLARPHRPSPETQLGRASCDALPSMRSRSPRRGVSVCGDGGRASSRRRRVRRGPCHSWRALGRQPDLRDGSREYCPEFQGGTRGRRRTTNSTD
jgi:hypothetical protein